MPSFNLDSPSSSASSPSSDDEEASAGWVVLKWDHSRGLSPARDLEWGFWPRAPRVTVPRCQQDGRCPSPSPMAPGSPTPPSSLPVGPFVFFSSPGSPTPFDLVEAPFASQPRDADADAEPPRRLWRRATKFTPRRRVPATAPAVKHRFLVIRQRRERMARIARGRAEAARRARAAAAGMDVVLEAD